MAVTIGGRQWRTLNNDIRVNGTKVTEITAGGHKVYPDSAHAIRLHLKVDNVIDHSLDYAGMTFHGGIDGQISNEIRSGGVVIGRSTSPSRAYDYMVRRYGTSTTNYSWYDSFYMTSIVYGYSQMWREYHFSARYHGDIVLTIRSKDAFGLVAESGSEWLTGYRHEGYPYGVWTNTNSSGWSYPTKRVALNEQPLLGSYSTDAYDDVIRTTFLEASKIYPWLPYESPLDFDVVGTAHCDGVFHGVWDHYKQDDWANWFDVFGDSVDIHARNVKLKGLKNVRNIKFITDNGTLRIGCKYDAVEIPEMGEGRRYIPLTHVLIAAPALPESGYDSGSVKCIFHVSGYEFIS